MERPHIIINLPDEFPEIVVEKVIVDIKQPGLKLKVNKIPNEPFASLEWAIPGAIAIFITKSYFSSFLNELGKDHYTSLQNWIKKTAVSTKAIKVKTLTANQSTHKNNENSQSKAFSLHLQTINGKNLKLLFDLDLNDQVWEYAIDSMFQLIKDHFENSPDDKLSQILSEFVSERKIIYAFINRKTYEWEFFEDIVMRRKKISIKSNKLKG